MDLPAGLTHRPLTVADAPAVFEIWAASEQEHLGEVLVEETEVVNILQVPSMDLERDSVAVVDGERLVAWATLNRGNGLVDVAASHHGRGIGTWIAGWLAGRAGPDGVYQEVHVGDDRSEAVLAANGYEVAFTSWILRLPAESDVPTRDVPDGFEIGSMTPGEERDVHAVVEAAFGEWGQRQPMSFEDWSLYILESKGFEPSRIAVARHDGRVVGACVPLDTDGDDCWIAQLAVARDHRGRGLAQAMMARAFAEGRERGRPVGILATDSRTGALPLYEKVGMRIAHEAREWHLDTT